MEGFDSGTMKKIVNDDILLINLAVAFVDHDINNYTVENLALFYGLLTEKLHKELRPYLVEEYEALQNILITCSDLNHGTIKPESLVYAVEIWFDEKFDNLISQEVENAYTYATGEVNFKVPSSSVNIGGLIGRPRSSHVKNFEQRVVERICETFKSLLSGVPI